VKALLLIGLAVGCSSKTAPVSGSCGDGGCVEVGDSGGGGFPDVVTFDSGLAPGACDMGSGSTCNSLSNQGLHVTPTCSTDSPPTMSGGTIADGTYVLKSATLYASSCSGATPAIGPTTLHFTGSCVQSVDGTGSENYGWAADGASFTLHRTCPSAFEETLRYTASGKTIMQIAPYLGGGSLVSVLEAQ
jgi:hypothetical protein